MANIRFIGGAAATPKKYTWTLTGTATLAGTITCAVRNMADSTDISTVTATVAVDDTAATVATALYNALIAVGVSGEFKTITWENPSDGVIRGTGQSDGRPVVLKITVATVTGISGYASPVTVSSSSPADVANTRNWEGGSLPTGSDVAVFDVNVPAKYNLDQFVATAVKVKRTPNHRSDIGLSVTHATYGFTEYLPTHFQTTGTTIEVYDAQQGLCQIDSQLSGAVSLKITGTIATNRSSFPVSIKGTNATFTVSSVGGAYEIYSGTIGTLTAISSLVSIPNVISATNVTFNACVAFVYLTVTNSATLTTNSDVTWLAGSSVTTTKVHTVEKGSVSRWQSTGLIGTLVLGLNGALDCTGTPAVCTVDSIALSAGAVINDPYERITRPYTVTLTSCAPTDVTLNLGTVTSMAVS